jgi:hypothetical protein
MHHIIINVYNTTTLVEYSFQLHGLMDKQQLIKLVRLCTQTLSIIICANSKHYVNTIVSEFVGLLLHIL